MQDSQQAHVDSDAQTTVVTHLFNLLGRRIATNVVMDGKPPEPLARYHYNADGSLAEVALGPDGLPRKYRYDPLGELTQIADPAMTETLDYKLPGDQGYGDGNITEAAYELHYTGGVSHTYAYSYDPHDRLTAAYNDQAQLSGSSLEAVTYDPNGNIRSERRGDGQTRTYALAPKTDQVTAVTGDGVNAHYAYDTKGRMSGASGDGAPDVASLDYDPLNNLPRQVSGANDLEVDYHYDVHNRRVAKAGHHVDGSNTSTRVYYRGQGAAALTELAGAAAALEPQTYVRGPGGLQAVTLQGRLYFVSRDHLGSTRALMDATGKVAAYFNYTPFGSLMPGNSQDDGGLAAHMAYRFAGTEYDAETGLYNNRARWYAPTLGRFLTPDPDYQYPSPYVYVGNNPVNGVDPTGMMRKFWKKNKGKEKDNSNDDNDDNDDNNNENQGLWQRVRKAQEKMWRRGFRPDEASHPRRLLGPYRNARRQNRIKIGAQRLVESNPYQNHPYTNDNIHYNLGLHQRDIELGNKNINPPRKPNPGGRQFNPSAYEKAQEAYLQKLRAYYKSELARLRLNMADEITKNIASMRNASVELSDEDSDDDASLELVSPDDDDDEPSYSSSNSPSYLSTDLGSSFTEDWDSTNEENSGTDSDEPSTSDDLPPAFGGSTLE
ncbi:MAG: RHS repeat-associated core domain-containing protein [Pseudomonadota bacterium]